MEAAEAQPRPLSLLHKSVAAAGASVVSAFVVNPLDVVKTRIQAQGAMGLHMQISDTLLEKWSFAACNCVQRAPPSPPGAPQMAAAAAAACGPACTSTAGSTASSSRAYTGTIDGLRKIVRQEGMRVLWRGTDVALMMAVPMVGIYLPLYDFLLLRLQQQLQQLAAQQGQGQGQGQQYPIGGGAWAPLVAGTLARTAAVFCTAPFELARTRLQAGHAQPATASAAASAVSGGGSRTALLLQHMPSREGGSRLRAAGRMWTGVGATLARDVPFSALYWGMVEPIRGALLPPRAADAARLSEWEVFAANVTAGAVAGGLAGAITTPFDVLKTRAQLQTGRSHPLLRSLRSIGREEGLAGLFRGWSARSAKAAPACAIVLSSYEMIKHIYE